MYAANLQDQLINAAFPLKPLTTWAGGACTVTVAVPPTQSTVGITIDSVSVELLLPSGQSASADAVNVPNSPNWVATFAAELFATSGFVENGLTVRLGGTDERSASRVWIVSKGDLEVKPGDASPSPSGSYVVIKLRDSAPTEPLKGDAYISGGTLYVYDGSAWQTIGGGGVVVDEEISASSPNPVRNSAIAAALADKQAALSSAQLAAVNSGVTSAKVATWDGYAAQIALKASLTDLPYRLVEPGKWEFSEPQGLTNFAVTLVEYDDGYWTLYYTSDETSSDSTSSAGNETDLSVTFYVGASGESVVTATRASLPGHLCDRAGNRVMVTGDTTLTLPAAVPGYLRDFLVRLEISGSTVPTITFAAPTGETITYETDGDEFPVPDEAGTWLYSFTESCVSHKFAVSLKKVNEVAQAAQGGA